MRKLFYILHFLYLLCGRDGYAQNSVVDSLQSALALAKQDTLKIKILNDIFLEYEFADEQKAQQCLNDAIQLAEKGGYQKEKANTFMLFGYFSEDKGAYATALRNYFSALKLFESIDEQKGVSAANSNIAMIYVNQGNYPEALKLFFKSLKIDEAVGDKIGIASSYSHIGNLYGMQNNYAESMKNHQRSLDLSKEANDELGVAFAYNNMGNVLFRQGKFEAALENYTLSLKIKKELADVRGISTAYNNIASVYICLADKVGDQKARTLNLDKAYENSMISLKQREIIGDKAGVASSYSNIGAINLRQGKFTDAEKNIKKSIMISFEIGDKQYLRENYAILSELDSAKGDFKGAYENHKLYILYRDSLDNEETRKKIIQSQMTFDFEKKEAVAEAEHKKELESQELIAAEKSRKQMFVLIFVSGFLLVVALFAVFIFRSLRITKKQKSIIEAQKMIVEEQKRQVEHQKLLVEEHQKEIIDSIYYARRIQRSLLPTEIYIEKNLNRLKKIN